MPADVTQEEMAAFEKNTGLTRNQLFNICMMLALARSTDKKDALMAYAFHNRTDQASIEDLFNEVDEKIAAIPESTGADGDGKMNKRHLMADE